jgi:hypothetical protein
MRESVEKIVQAGARQVYLSHGGVFPVERIRKMVGSFD